MQIYQKNCMILVPRADILPKWPMVDKSTIGFFKVDILGHIFLIYW